MTLLEMHTQLGQLLQEFPESADATVVVSPVDGGFPGPVTEITYNGDAAQIELSLVV
jgi:hypothetical protein